MRGLSAIIVLLAHCHQVFIAPEYRGLYPVFGLMAQAAVMVFFVLSGFLITKSITRNYCDGGFSVKSYAIDRFDRIYPPFLVSMLLMIALVALAPLVFPSGSGSFLHLEAFLARQGLYLDWVDLAGAAVFLNGFVTDGPEANGPLWSLSFEVWYYIAAGMIAWQRRLGVLLAIVVIVGLGVLNRPFAVYSVVWFAGVLVALLHNHGANLRGYARVGVAAMGAAATAAALLFIWQFAESGSLNDRLVVAYNVGIGLMFACLLHLLCIKDLSLRPVAPDTAAFSYTLYVIHFPLLLFVFGATQDWAVGSVGRATVVAAMTSIVAVMLSVAIARRVETRRPLKGLARVPAE